MIVRYCRENEREVSKKIWLDTFRDSEEYIDWYMESVHRNENNLFILEDNEIVGMLYENPYEIKILNRIEKSIYMVAVAIENQYRGEGYFKKLMEESLRNLKSQGIGIVFLHPVSSEIYKRFGFIYGSNVEKYTCQLKEIPVKTKKYKIIEISEKNNLKDLVKIYNKSMENCNISMVKDEENLKKLFKETSVDGGKTYGIACEDGKLQGYFTYTMDGEDIFIKELAFENKNAFETMMWFFKTLENYYKNLQIITYEGSQLNLYLDREEILRKEVVPQIQFRILNIKEYLENIYILLNKDEEFILKIKDRLFSDECYRISRGEAEKVETENYHVEISIETLTQLITGYLNIEEALKLEKINILDEEKLFLLKKIKPQRKSFFNQFF